MGGTRLPHPLVDDIIYCTSRNQAGVFAKGKIRQNIKFAAFWSVFFVKNKGRY